MAFSRKNVSYYNDIDFDFAMNDLTEDFKILNGQNSVSQSIKNLVLTNPGERPFSTMGAGIMSFLNEPDDIAANFGFKDRISSILKLYEPRINVNHNDISKEILNNGSVRINIKYTLADDLEIGNIQSLSLVVSKD